MEYTKPFKTFEEQAAWHPGWRDRLFDLLDTRSAGELRMMGFAGNWRECPFWAPWIAECEGDSGESSELA